MFVPGRSFQPSLMFVSKTGDYQSEAPLRHSTQGLALGLSHKHSARLETPAKDKHSSLLRSFVKIGAQKIL